MKRKKSKKPREKTSNSEKLATKLSGLVVEALSDIFEKQKKKKRLTEKGRQAALNNSMPCIGKEIEARDVNVMIDSNKDVQIDMEGGTVNIHTTLNHKV